MNDMLSQPPPDAPAPPPSGAAIRSRRKMVWLLGVGMFSVVCVIGYGIHEIDAKIQEGNLTEATNNLRAFGLALFSFEEDYGSYPSAATAAEVPSSNPHTGFPLGNASSNECFRQLIASGHIDQEKPFYAKSWNSRKPDNDMRGENCVGKGETAFSYIEGLSSVRNPPETPLVVLPLVPGKRLFDYKLSKKYYGGMAIVLFIDMNVKSFPVDKSGHVYINGKDLFDPSQPFWHGKLPEVKWPE